jgi:hypothetical protein
MFKNDDSIDDKSSQILFDDHRLLGSLKKHILQLEALVIYLLIATMTQFIVSAALSGRYRYLDWFVPCIFLAGTRAVVRVTNPPSTLRTKLTWLATSGGIGGTIGGAIGLLVDIGTLGISGGAGTLIGFTVGGAIGAAFSGKLEGSSEFLEKGDAFDFLYDAHRKNKKVATPQLVEEALKQIPSFDKNDDGRHWYAKGDLKQFLQTAATPAASPPSPSSPAAQPAV